MDGDEANRFLHPLSVEDCASEDYRFVGTNILHLAQLVHLDLEAVLSEVGADPFSDLLGRPVLTRGCDEHRHLPSPPSIRADLAIGHLELHGHATPLAASRASLFAGRGASG